MPNASRLAPARMAAIFLAVTLGQSASAQSVWSGLSLSFSKAGGTDETLTENQDRITSNVWLTRAAVAGLFNIAQENGYVSSSPAGTQWATDLNNPGDTIAAANWAGLSFASWIDAYGGTGGGLPSRLIGRKAVVHLITDSIYLDLKFTGWTQQGGAGFSYLRAVHPVPEPATGAHLLCGALVLGLRLFSRR